MKTNTIPLYFIFACVLSLLSCKKTYVCKGSDDSGVKQFMIKGSKEEKDSYMDEISAQGYRNVECEEF